MISEINESMFYRSDISNRCSGIDLYLDIVRGEAV